MLRRLADRVLHNPEVSDGSLVVVGRAVATGLSAGWMLVAARELSLSQFADLALFATIVVIAVQLSDAGVSVELPRALVDRPESSRASLRAAAWRRLRVSVPLGLISVGAYAVASSSFAPATGVGLVISIVATSVYGAFATGLRALRRYRSEAVIEPASRAVFLCVAVLGARSGWGVPELSALYGAVDLLTAAAYAQRCEVLRFSLRDIGRLPAFRAAHLAMPLAAVGWRLDTWLLALLSNAREVAFYTASYRLLDAALLPSLVIASLLPARVLERSEDTRRAMIVRWSSLAAMTTVPFFVVSMLAAGPVLRTLYGTSFEAGAASLRLLAAVCVVTAVALVLTSAIAVLDVGSYFRAVLLVTVGTGVADLVLLGKLGANGAAGITLVGQIALVTLLIRALTRRRSEPSRELG